MARFVRFALLLWIACLVLIGFIVLGGRTVVKAYKLQTMGFDLCDEKPCFAGIVPGVTAWDTVPSHLTIAKRVDEIKHGIGALLESGHYVEFDNRAANTVRVIGLTQHIAVLKPENYLFAGDFIEQYGQPCSVILFDSSIRLVYSSMLVDVDSVTNDHFHLLSPVADIQITPYRLCMMQH